jgi:pimeloyl-ACP methyl ester carboxylesterase
MNRFFVLLPLLSACATMRSGALETHALSVATPARCVVVMLPGIGDDPEKFQRFGFEEAVRSSDAPCDVVLVNAHFGYYRRPELPAHLATEVLAPLRSRYEAVWLVGVSLGGYGAALTASEYPELVDGVVLISPFLGVPTSVKALTTRIEAGGGLAAFDGEFGTWTRPERHLVDVGPVWKWLGERTRSPSAGTELYLGYGASDPFVAGDRVLADALEDERALTLAGGHTWETFSALFKRIAATTPWATRG